MQNVVDGMSFLKFEGKNKDYEHASHDAAAFQFQSQSQFLDIVKRGRQ